MKKTFTIILALIGASTELSYCQSNAEIQNNIRAFTINRDSRLLYYVENSTNQTNEFLIPFIQSELKALIVQSDHKRRPLFSEVNSLNQYLSVESTNKSLIRAITLFNRKFTVFKSNKQALKEDTLISNILRKQDWFLKVNINLLNNQIEYQFVLFKIGKPTRRDQPSYIELHRYRTSSIFIDPNSTTYKDQLRSAVRQIMVEGNVSPEPYITYNQKPVNDTLFVPEGVLTIAGNATDIDSDPQQLSFKWHLADPDRDTVMFFQGKTFNATIYGEHHLELSLTASDGITSRTTPYLLVSKPAPDLHILPPEEGQMTDFHYSIYHLYSFHRRFTFNDFSGFFQIKTPQKIKKPEYAWFLNWSLLIPEVNILSNLPETNQVSISSINFKTVNDSLLYYKEKALQNLDKQNYTWQLSDETNSFKIRTFRATQSAKNGTESFTHKFAIYLRDAGQLKIKTPDVKTFKVTASDHGINSTENFQIEFDKISPFNPYFSESFTYGLSKLKSSDGKAHRLSFLNLGIGTEYRVIPNITADAFVGTGALIATHTDYYEHSARYYIKAGVNICFLTYHEDTKVSLILTALRREAFSFTSVESNTKTYVYTRGNSVRPGYGLSFDVVPYNTYHYAMVTADFFIVAYPKTDNFGTGNLEVGGKLKFFIKHRS